MIGEKFIKLFESYSQLVLLANQGAKTRKSKLAQIQNNPKGKGQNMNTDFISSKMICIFSQNYK